MPRSQLDLQNSSNNGVTVKKERVASAVLRDGGNNELSGNSTELGKDKYPNSQEVLRIN